jgi:hypothetical protein
MVEELKRTVVLASLLALGCGRAPAPAVREGPRLLIEEKENPAAPGSGEASLVAWGNGRAVLSWIEPAGDGGHALRLAAWETGRFSDPRTVKSGKGFFVNWADFPTIAALGADTLFAHWLERSGSSRYAYEVMLSRSPDGGRTWSAAVVPHTDRSAVEHGFVSMTEDGTGSLALVWLDGRARTATALLSARVNAEGTVSPETTVDPKVCDCCQTAVTRTSRGLLAAYRDRSDDEIRDIAVARFEEGRWTEGGVVAADRWKIDGCPVNGPALAAEGERVALAWFSMEPKPRVRLALSRDGGRSFGKAMEVSEGRALGRVDVAFLATGDAVVSFLERAPAKEDPAARGETEAEAPPARLLLRLVSAEGRLGPTFEAAPTTGARSSGFPRLERASANTLLLAWRDAGEPARLHTATVRTEGP